MISKKLLKKFALWVATEVCDDDFEDNAGVFAEVACRKLAHLSFVRADDDRWTLNLTNADRIRSMTDEELAEWLNTIVECGDDCPAIEECCEKEEMGFCYPSLLEWLKRRAQ